MAVQCKRGVLPLALVLLACLLPAPSAGAAGPDADAPTCAEGPERSGDVIVGTPCADTIHVPASVQRVDSGAGNDTIIAGPITAFTECPAGCRLELGSSVYEGGPGNDIVWGGRGNDILRGNGGNDRLYGGIGDDIVEGGIGDDLVSGGFGADLVDGGSGSDFARGDPTQDEILDSGPAGDVDTLSYATGATPGFGNDQAFPGIGNPPVPDFSGEHANFPATGPERGVFLNLAAPSNESGNNGGAPNGGGVDEVVGPDFERVVGSPFSDYIVGGSSTQAIFGGGGADVLIAGNGATTLNGGADGDDCVNGAVNVSCESTAAKGPVTLRDRTKVSVGAMAPGEGEYASLYLVGSESADEVTVSSSGIAPNEAVTFQLGAAGSEFDEAASAQSGCEVKSSGEAVCELTTSLDSVLLAGLEGDDTINASALPATTSVMLLGGNNADELTAGNETDDTLVDGPGNDVLHGLAGDDGLVNNQGRDELFAEAGNDLFLSVVVCEGDLINGGPGRDNSSWAKFDGDGLPNEPGIEARLDQGRAGRPGGGGEPECAGKPFDSLEEIEDLEGSSLPDVLIGDAGENQLLGHQGADSFFSFAGNDTILANAGDNDVAIDCGEGVDTALIDIRPKYNDPVPVECETVREAEPNNYRVSTPVVPPPAPIAPDVKPPRTKVTRHPAKVLWTAKRHRRVVFRFSSSERGSRFRCKLDAKPYRACASPRAYNLGLGRHVVRIDAIDAAGNSDPTPAIYRFRIRQFRHR